MVRRAAEHYLASYAGLPRSVWLLACVLLINRCGTMVVPFLTIYLTQQRGYEPIAVGWLLSASALGGVLGAYLGGWLTQRFGPIGVVVGTLALTAPTYAVIPYCHSLPALFVALVAQQVTNAATRPAVSTAITFFTPTDRHAQALALNRLAINLGCSIGPVIGGLLAEIDFYWIFPTNAVFSVGAALAAFVFFASTHAPDSAGATPDEEPASVSPASSPWRDPVFLGFLGLLTLGEVIFFQVLVTVPLYWREWCGFGEALIGVLFAVNTALIVLCEMPLTRWARRFRPLGLVATGVGCYGVGFALTPFGTTALAAAALVVVWTVGEMLSAPFSATYAAGRSSRKQRGPYMAAYAMAFSVANVIAPIVGLALYEWSPLAPWWCALGLTGLISGGFLSLIRADRTRASAPAAA